MAKDSAVLAEEAKRNFAKFREASPAVTSAFGALSKAVFAAGALDTATKELIAFGIAICVRCEGCIVHHARTLARLGVAREQVVEAVAVAIEMGGGPSTVYGPQALQAFDEFAAERAARKPGG
jgi:AhpD family alkylhydroperoxidase